MINRFSVPPLFQSTQKLAKIASGKLDPDLVLFNARILSTYTDRILEKKEIWISNGRIVCVKENGDHQKIFNKSNILFCSSNLAFSRVLNTSFSIASKFSSRDLEEILRKSFPGVSWLLVCSLKDALTPPVMLD